jgi:hypothetical protein
MKGELRGHNDMPFGWPTPAGLSAARWLATLRAYLVVSLTID